MDSIFEIIDSIQSYAKEIPLLAILLSTLALIIDSIIPIFPSMAVIILKVEVLVAVYENSFFAKILAILISTAAMVFGSLLGYLLARSLLYNRFKKKWNKSNRYNEICNFINKRPPIVLGTILCFPMLPLFLVNIVLALTNVKLKDYLVITIISRALMATYVVFLGSNILDFKNHPKTSFISIVVFVVIVFIGYLINKFFVKSDTGVKLDDDVKSGV